MKYLNIVFQLKSKLYSYIKQLIIRMYDKLHKVVMLLIGQILSNNPFVYDKTTWW